MKNGTGADAEQRDGALDITVSDPVKQGEGINAFVSYKVNTTTNLPAFESPQFFQIRRFSDWDWLHAQLVRDFPGVVVPPLPEKLVMGRFSEEFVEARRRSLEKFLNRVALHPQLRESLHFKAFLEYSEEAFAAAKEAANRSRKSKGFWQWASETQQSLTHKLGAGAGAGAALREPTEEDAKFVEASKYIQGFEPQIQNVHKHTQGLIKRSREMANGLFEFGLAFTLLGQSEADSLGNALTQLGHTADKLSVLAAEEAEKEALYFEEPVRDYVRMAAAVKQALDTRTSHQLAYEAALADLQAKTAAHNRIAASAPGPKAAQAEQEVAKAQQRVDETKKSFELVSERVLAEMERFKREKLADFRALILDYVQLRIEFSRKTEEAWRGVLPDLQAIAVDEGAAGSGGAAGLSGAAGGD